MSEPQPKTIREYIEETLPKRSPLDLLAEGLDDPDFKPEEEYKGLPNPTIELFTVMLENHFQLMGDALDRHVAESCIATATDSRNVQRHLRLLGYADVDEQAGPVQSG